ncbi:MAG: hypothetical protein ACHQ6U_04930 [Thermodesulfobacteriota bacterium]
MGILGNILNELAKQTSDLGFSQLDNIITAHRKAGYDRALGELIQTLQGGTPNPIAAPYNQAQGILQGMTPYGAQGAASSVAPMATTGQAAPLSAWTTPDAIATYRTNDIYTNQKEKNPPNAIDQAMKDLFNRHRVEQQQRQQEAEQYFLQF